MAQGNKKTGQKGTDSIFVTTHDKILRIPADGTITYARIVLIFAHKKQTHTEFGSRQEEI
jgi:hypothetical protein